METIMSARRSAYGLPALALLLCLLHFGSRHHLHGTSYLTGIFYAFYPYSDVSGVCHFLERES